MRKFASVVGFALVGVVYVLAVLVWYVILSRL